MKRFGLAAAIAFGIYGVAVGTGSLLYVTGAIATGATHNDCDRAVIAWTLGKAQDDVTAQELKTETRKCLDAHTLTKGEAFRIEDLVWSSGPAEILTFIILACLVCGRTLHNQEQAEIGGEASRLSMGT